MPQLTIYIDPKTEQKVRRAAKAEKLSLSRWVRDRLLEAASSDQWPAHHFDCLGMLAHQPMDSIKRSTPRQIQL
jgi:hypothetical protein